MSNTSTGKPPTSQTSKKRLIIDEIGRDTKTGIIGRGYSPDNGKTFYVLDTIYGRLYGANDINAIWNNGTSDRVKKMVDSATAEIPAVKLAADEAVKKADSAIASSKVNSDAIVAQSEAISEAKAAMDSATAEIQQTAANAASDAAKIRADVAQVQNEVDTAKAANSASVEALKSDVSAAKQDIQAARQANENVAKQLDDYTKQAQAQGKTIKDIQNAQDGYTATLADVKGNVSKISDAVDGLSASLKDDQDNVATIKAKADELSATLTDHDKNIAQLTASAKELGSTLEDADGRISKVEQTAKEHTSTISDLGKKVDSNGGGVNLLTNTQLFDYNWTWERIGHSFTNGVLTLSDTNNGNSRMYQVVAGGNTTGRTFSLSFNARISADCNSKSVQVKAGPYDVLKFVNITSQDFQPYKVENWQWTGRSGTFSFYVNGGKIDITNLKLEYGAVATPYSLAPADLATISQVKQTADSINTTLKNVQGDVDQVIQKATGTEQTVANQQGQINNIKTDAAGIHETLTGQGNQIANINVTLNGFNSKYEGVSGDLGKLKSSALQDRGTVSAPDFNSLTQAGYYTVTLTSHGKNYPTPHWGTLEVSGQTGENGRLSQRFTGDNNAETYVRQYNANTKSWTAWIKTANQNDVTALSNRITTNSTQITQNKSAIALKADQTVVDAVKNTASQNSSRLDVMANEVKSKVTSTDVNNIVNDKGYATTSTVQSLVDQKAGTISESITNLTNEVNTRNGVNLLKGTKDFSGSWHNYGSTNCWHTENWIDPNGNHSVKSDSMSLYGYYQPIYLDTGDYTFSGYYYSEGGKPVFCYIRPNYGDNLVEVSYNSNLDSTPNGWRWFVVHFKVTKAGNAAVRLESGQNQILHIASYKLERGTVDNPVWTPAPSDNATVTQVQQITASIDGLQSIVQNKADKSQITQLSNVIQSKVSTSDFTSKVSQLSNDINLRVKSGDLLSQLNLEAGRALFQSKKIFMDADTVVMGPNTKAFIPSAAITNVDADIINTGVLDGIEIRQVPTNGRSIDIKDGNIAISSNDPYEPRISFTNDGKDAKMFNAVGDIEVLNQEFSLFNFTPDDTSSTNPIPFFRVVNTGNTGSGSAHLYMDHAIIDGYEWWTPSGGITFGRTWDGINTSSDYVDLYAKSFVPHSELSAKTRIKKLDRKEALDKIMQDDMYTYQFKEDVRDGVSKRYASFIIDNVHDVAQYAEPEEFLSANGKGRDDGTQLAYLIAAVQYQQEQIKELKKKLEEK